MDSNKSNWSNRLFSKTTKEPKLNQPRKTSWHSLGRHGVGVRCVALSSDRQLALLSYEKGTLDLCEVEMGQSVKTFPASGAPVCSLALHTEGSLALSGHEDGSILTLDLSTGKGEPMLEKHLAPVAALSLSLDARFVFSGAVRDSSFKMWSTTSRKFPKGFQNATPHLRLVAVDGERRVSLSAMWDYTHRINTLELRQIMTRELLLKYEGSGSDMVNLALAAGGQYALVQTAEGMLYLIDLGNSDQRSMIDARFTKFKPRCLALGRDGLVLLGSASGAIDNELSGTHRRKPNPCRPQAEISLQKTRLRLEFWGLFSVAATRPWTSAR